MKLLDHHRSYLERTARTLSIAAGRRVTAANVLHVLLDMAIEDEGLFDPEDLESPLSPTRRELFVAQAEGLSTRLGLPALTYKVSQERHPQPQDLPGSSSESTGSFEEPE